MIPFSARKAWLIGLSSSLVVGLVVLAQQLPQLRVAFAAVITLMGAAISNHLWRRHREDTSAGRMKTRVRRGLFELRRQAGRDAMRLPWYVVIGTQASGKSGLIDGSDMLVHASYAPKDAPEPHARMLSTSDGIFIDTPGRLTHQGHHNELGALVRLLSRRLGKKRMGGVVVAMRVADLQQPELFTGKILGALTAILFAVGRRIPVTLVLTQADRLPGFCATFAAADSLNDQPWGFSLADNDEIALSCSNRMTTLIETLRRFSVGQLGSHESSAQRAQQYMFPQTLAQLTRPLQQFVESVFGARARPDTFRLAGVYLCAAPPSLRQSNPHVEVCEPSSDPSKPGSWLIDWQSMAPKEPLALGEASVPKDAEALGSLGADATANAYALSVLDKSALDAGFGANGGIASPRAAKSKAHRSFFVTGLFSRVLGHHAALNEPLSQPGLRGLWAAARPQCCCALMLFGIFLLTARAAYLNARWLGEAQRLIAPMTGQATERDLEDILAPLGAFAETLERNARLGAPLGQRFGMYRGDKLVRPIAQLYLAMCDALIVGKPAGQFLRDAMDAWQHFGLTSEPLLPEHSRALLTGLHIHLLLTAPKDEGEKTLAEAEEATWLRDTLLAATADQSEDTKLQADLRVLIERYIGLVARLPALLAERSPQQVSQARSLLARRPLAERLVDGIVQDAMGLGEPLTVDDIVSLGRLPLRHKASVARAFTRAGFLEVARARLDALENGAGAWIFEPLPKSLAKRQELVRDTKACYYSRYAGAWLRFLDGLSWRELGTVWAARQLLDGVTADETPALMVLLEAVAANTELEAATSSAPKRRMLPMMQRLLGRTVSDAPLRVQPALRIETAAHVEAAFLPIRRWLGRGQEQPPGQQASPAALYQEQLIALRQAVVAFMDDPSASQSLDEPLRQARLNTAALLDSIPPGSGVRPRLRSLLLGPIEQATRALARGVRSRSDGSWGPEVAQPARRLLRQYPFYAGGIDASVAEVHNFFRPGSGTLWGYHRRELAHDIVREGARFVFDERMGGVVRHAYRPDVLRYFTQAQAVTQALFASGEGSEPVLDIEVRLITTADADGAELSYGGNTLVVARGSASSAWQRWQWPPNDVAQGATHLSARGKHVANAQWQHDGIWGLWRLFESGRPQIERSYNTLTIYWPLGGHQSAIGLEVRPLRRNHPLFEGDASTGLFGALRSRRLWPPGRLTPDEAAQARATVGSDKSNG